MFWLAALAIQAGIMQLQSLLKQNLKNPAKKYTLADFQVPTIEPGQTLRQIYGRVQIKDPFVAWYGDLRSRHITDGGTRVGYRYYMGSQLVICSGPGVNIVEFHVDDEPRPFTTRQLDDSIELWVDLNGVREIQGDPTVHFGRARLYQGSSTQQRDSYLNAVYPDPGAPDWPGFAYLVLGAKSPDPVDNLQNAFGWYVGDSGTAKRVGGVFERYPTIPGLAAGKERIGNNSNPACIVYDIWTAPRQPYGGAGRSPSEIDVAGLIAHANRFYDEGLGLSFDFREQSSDERVLEVLRHVDAVRFVDPVTGLLGITAVRDDYDPANLPVFDTASIKNFIHRPADPSTAPNIARVYFTNASARYLRDLAEEKDRAAIEARGGVIDPIEVDLPGITDAATAQAAAARLLQSSAARSSCSGLLDRRAWSLTPASLIKINWAPSGLSGLIVRISRLRHGDSADGEISFEGLQDDFSADWTTYGTPPPTGWSPPAVAAPLAAQRVVEAPRALPGYIIQDDTDRRAYALVLAARSGAETLGFSAKILSDDSTYLEVADSSAFCPRAQLSGALTETSPSILVKGLQDMGLVESVTPAEFEAGKNLIVVNGEIIAFRSIAATGSGNYLLTGLARGCVDTLPGHHAAGADVWFVTYGRVLIPVTAPNDLEATHQTSLKLQPYTSAGALDLNDCSASTVTVGTASRAVMPAIPARIRLGLTDYPSTIPDQLSMSWMPRNRLNASNFGKSNATVVAEPGVTYSIRVYGETGTLIHSEDALSGILWVYPAYLEKLESGLDRLNYSLRVKFWAVRDEYSANPVSSWETFDWTVTRP